MYIHRLITRGIPGLQDQDLTFYNEWTNAPLRNVLITGPNGSGKTTLLRVMAGLWFRLPLWLRFEPVDEPLLRQFALLAVEIRDLHPDQSVWVYLADSLSSERLLQTLINESTPRIGQVNTRDPVDMVRHNFEHTRWLSALGKKIDRLQLTGQSDDDELANLIYLPAERQVRRHTSASRDNNLPRTEPLRRYLVSYEGTGVREADLEIQLSNLKLRDPDWFYRVIADVNQFLNGKQITDFGDLNRDLRLIVEADTTTDANGFQQHARHAIYDLSSGERQALLLMFIVSRWQMQGGVVLIDEPDLHLHVSLQRQLIAVLERLVVSRNGQLIVTSHSPEVWSRYNAYNRFELGTAQQVEHESR